MGRPKKYRHGCPSVTELCDILSPFNPKWWYVATRKKLVAQGADLNKLDPIAVCEQYKRESQTTGHKVHKGIELFLQGRTFSESSEGMTNNQKVMLSYLTDWCSTTKIRPIALEETIYYECPLHKEEYDPECEECAQLFGGTPDAIATFDDGKTLSVVDWKTSNIVTSRNKNISKYRLQVTGYALAYERTYGVPVQSGHIVFATKDLKFASVPIEITDRDKEMFLRIRSVHEYKTNG